MTSLVFLCRTIIGIFFKIQLTAFSLRTTIIV
nr:MAG TPA: hypothetical protein [Caudoviricetes sp.]